MCTTLLIQDAISLIHVMLHGGGAWAGDTALLCHKEELFDRVAGRLSSTSWSVLMMEAQLCPSCADLSVNICGGEVSQSFPGQAGVVFFIEPHLDVVWKNGRSHESLSHGACPPCGAGLASHLSGPCHTASRPPLHRSRSPLSGPSSRSSGWTHSGPLRAEGEEEQLSLENILTNSRRLRRSQVGERQERCAVGVLLLLKLTAVVDGIGDHRLQPPGETAIAVGEEDGEHEANNAQVHLLSLESCSAADQTALMV